MPRQTPRPEPDRQITLSTLTDVCPACGRHMHADHKSSRLIATLNGLLGLTCQIRRCHGHRCDRFLDPYRPESEGRLALPGHHFGLDVIAFVGQSRYLRHRSVPEIHQDLRERAVMISPRSTRNLLDRYDELLSLAASDPTRLRGAFAEKKRVILAIDGLQPEVGHEVLWVIRDCLSGRIVLAESLLSARAEDLGRLLARARESVGVEVAGVVSDGQASIRNAVADTLPGVPHQLCHFHFLREAAKPIYEADRHAKKQLKKKVRGVRAIERQAEAKDDPESELVLDYCQAVRASLTDDGRPPLDAKGLLLEERLTKISESLERLSVQKGGSVDH